MMEEIRAIGTLEILRDLAKCVIREAARQPKYAYAGSVAWTKLITELRELTGLPLSTKGGEVEFHGLFVKEDNRLPPNTILVGIEDQLQERLP